MNKLPVVRAAWLAPSLAILLSSSGVPQRDRLNQALCRARGEFVHEAKVSPDSSLVVYETRNDDQANAGFFSVAAGGGMPMRLGPSPVVSFDISPDAKRVVYQRKEHLYSIPIDGSKPEVRLSKIEAAPGQRIDWQISPDAFWVVYSADGLYRVPIDGRSTPQRVADSGSGVKISPDGSWLVYGSPNAQGQPELFSVSLRGIGVPVKLNPPLVSDGGIEDNYTITADSHFVVYLADQDRDEQWEVYSVPIDGSGQAINLSGPTARPGRDVESWSVSPDGTQVLFRTDREISQRFGLYRVPVDRASEPIAIHPPLAVNDDVLEYDFSRDGRWVVFGMTVGAAFGTKNEIYVAASSGLIPPRRLHPLLPPGGNARLFALDPHNGRVVYLADVEGDGLFRLYSEPIEREAEATLLDGPDLAQLMTFKITSDGSRVVFLSREPLELYSVPVDGSGPAVLLTGSPMDGPRVDFRFELFPDGKRVLALGQENWESENGVFSIRTDAGAPPVRLNGPLALGPSTGDVFAYQINGNGERLLFHADSPSEDSTRDEIYSVLADGSEPPVRIHPTRRSQTLEALLSSTSADGNWMAFLASDYEHSFDRLLARTDASSEPAVLLAGRRVYDTEFSPLSDSLVFAAEQNEAVHGLYAKALPNSGPAIELSGDMQALVTFLRITAEGRTAVYIASRFADGVSELMAVPTDGGATPTVRNGPLASGGDVRTLQLSPHGSSAVYVADQDADDVFELYRASVQGGAAWERLNGDLVTGGDVEFAFWITPDSSRVVYVADQEGDELFELFSATGGGAAPVKLSGAMVAGGDVRVPTHEVPGLSRAPMGEIAPDGSRIVYVADAESDEHFELFSAPVDGSSGPVKLSAGAHVAVFSYPFLASFRICPDSRQVVYRARAQIARPFELFVAPIDRSGPPRRLNPRLVADGGIEPGFQVSPDGRWVAYVADQRTAGVHELFAVPIAGGPSKRLNGSLVLDGDVQPRSLQFHPDSKRLYYIADQDTDGKFELYLTGVGVLHRKGGIK